LDTLGNSRLVTTLLWLH